MQPSRGSSLPVKNTSYTGGSDIPPRSIPFFCLLRWVDKKTQKSFVKRLTGKGPSRKRVGTAGKGRPLQEAFMYVWVFKRGDGKDGGARGVKRGRGISKGGQGSLLERDR